MSHSTSPTYNEEHRRTHWLEWAAILLAVCVYCLPFLRAGILPGRESEYFQAFDQLLRLGLQNGEFPLWNPLLATGLPNIAHPMQHIFNPFASLPVLLLGVETGFKIAVLLGFVIAAFGMWSLGLELGLDWPARVWLALMFAFCGLPAAKFLQGHYLLVIGLGWIPFSLAATLKATRSHHWSHICQAALALALLFLSGNAYYAYFMLYVFGLYALSQGLSVRTKPFELRLDPARFRILFAIGLLALGLSAIQLVPQLEYRAHYSKPLTTDFSDSQSMPEVLKDFTSPQPFRSEAFSATLRPEEYFAYTGWWPFIALLALPLAWKNNPRRRILFLLALIAFTFLWVDVRDMPWRLFFINVDFLAQFRYPSRMLAIGCLALISAAGLGLDGLWRRAKTARRWGLLLAVAVFLLGSLTDLAFTSRPLLNTVQIAPFNQAAEPTRWLHEFDPGLYYVTTPEGWPASSDLRSLKGEGVIVDLSRVEPQISERTIIARSKYLILPAGSSAPTGTELVKSFPAQEIYRDPQALPFAFTLSDATLTVTRPGDLSPQEVTEQSAFSASLNSIQGRVSSETDQALVILSTYNAGWQLSVDGQPQEVYNAYGYLAASVSPGRHTYRFDYRPLSFQAGLAVSLATLLAMLLLQHRAVKIRPHSAAPLQS